MTSSWIPANRVTFKETSLQFLISSIDTKDNFWGNNSERNDTPITRSIEETDFEEKSILRKEWDQREQRRQELRDFGSLESFLTKSKVTSREIIEHYSSKPWDTGKTSLVSSLSRELMNTPITLFLPKGPVVAVLSLAREAMALKPFLLERTVTSLASSSTNSDMSLAFGMSIQDPIETIM